jgi:hypothetical protein
MAPFLIPSESLRKSVMKYKSKGGDFLSESSSDFFSD